MARPQSFAPKIAVVIGAGTVGLRAALKLAVRGMRVSVLERHSVPQDVEFFADLVVDATGSTSMFASWRGTAGYTRVEDLDAALEERRELSVVR